MCLNEDRADKGQAFGILAKSAKSKKKTSIGERNIAQFWGSEMGGKSSYKEVTMKNCIPLSQAKRRGGHEVVGGDTEATTTAPQKRDGKMNQEWANAVFLREEKILHSRGEGQGYWTLLITRSTPRGKAGMDE